MVKSGLYRHYKGGLYQVLGVGRHSETLDGLVVYQHLDGNPGIWLRPIDMFLEDVEVDGKQVPRFTFISTFTEELPEHR